MTRVVPDVAIVTHNTDFYLLNLLESLEPLHASSSLGEVFVWDNASADDTMALLDAFADGRPWVRVHRSTSNLYHGPALDRLLRESCQREWVLVLDADTEVHGSLAAALCRDDLADATFVGQIHPEMPHLYAYLAHLLIHRPSYLELPPFRHHGAPGIDLFRAIEMEQRPYVRFRWCDYVHHYGQGSLRRVVERGDRANEFYEFATREAANHPTPLARRAREAEMRSHLREFLLDGGGRRAALSKATPAVHDHGTPVVDHDPIEARPRVGPERPRWRDVFLPSSLRRARVFHAARRLGLTQILSEAADLMRIVERQRPRRVIEIGTAHGGSLLLWARAAAADATLVSIDLPPWELDDPGEPGKRRAIERVGSHLQSIHLVRGNSHDPEIRARALACLRGEAPDFLFIDGDHSYEGVKRDYEDYASLVRPGGIVAFHDIHPHPRGWGGEVPRFWREIREHHRHAELIADRNQDGFGLGVIWIGDASNFEL